jgi:hypothetical protein
MICLTNSGIIAARMTSTRPTIDSAHVQPEPDGIPIAVSAVWNPYMIHATSHSIGGQDGVEGVAHDVLSAVPAKADGVVSRV